MKNLIEPLARIPGVRTAALVTTDGVIIAMHSASNKNGGARDANHAEGAPSDEREETSALDAALDPQALAGLATSWLGEIARAVGPLSWATPRHLVLRAARGTMIVCEAPGAILCVVLDSGMQPQELRLPMGVTIARMQRHLRDVGHRGHAEPVRAVGQHTGDRTPPAGDIEHLPGIRPAIPSSSPHAHAVPQGGAERIVHATGKGVSDVSGD